MINDEIENLKIKEEEYKQLDEKKVQKNRINQK